MTVFSLGTQKCTKTTRCRELNLPRFSMILAILSATSFWYLHLEVLTKVTCHINSPYLCVLYMGGGGLSERKENQSLKASSWFCFDSRCNTPFAKLLPHKTPTNTWETLKVISVVNSFHSTVMLTNFIQLLCSDCRIHFLINQTQGFNNETAGGVTTKLKLLTASQQCSHKYKRVENSSFAFSKNILNSFGFLFPEEGDAPASFQGCQGKAHPISWQRVPFPWEGAAAFLKAIPGSCSETAHFDQLLNIGCFPFEESIGKKMIKEALSWPCHLNSHLLFPWASLSQFCPFN